MPQQSDEWSKVDRYVTDILIPKDRHLDRVLETNKAEGLPAIDVSAPQGKLLAQYVKMTKASRVLELGTLGGYSTIWMAKALPPGDKVEVLGGNALEILPTLNGPYDFIFIDADKENYPNYLPMVLRLSRKGTVIVADNVVRSGGVADEKSVDIRVNGAQKFLHAVKEDPRLDATVIQTVGSKGWDGFALVTVDE